MKRYGSAVAALVLAASACAPGSDDEEKPTTLSAAVSVTAAPAAVASVKLSVWSVTGSPSYTFELAPPVAPATEWSGGGKVTPGDYFLQAQAFDAAGELLYSTDAVGPFAVAQGSTTLVGLVAQSVTPPSQYWNAPPRIDAIYVSTLEVEAGGAVQLIVLAKDPDFGSSLAYRWSEPEGAAGWFDDEVAPRTGWNAPLEDRMVSLHVSVTDDKGATAFASLKVKVGDPAGKVKAEIAFNSPPEVHVVSVDPTRVEPGQPVLVSAIATDPDGDPVSYYWYSPCGGWFYEPWAPSTTFVPPYYAQGCELAIRVEDGRGGINFGTSILWVGPPPQATVLPREIQNGSFETGDYWGWTIEQPVGSWAVIQGIASAGQYLYPGAYVYDHHDRWASYQYSPGLPITYEPSDGQFIAFTLNHSHPMEVFQPSTSRMYQDLRLPDVPEGARLLLAWDMAYTNHGGGFALNQRFGVQLLDVVTNVRLATVFNLVAGDPKSIPMTPFEADLTAWAGQTIRLNLLVAQTTGYLDHAIDNVRLVIAE